MCIVRGRFGRRVGEAGEEVAKLARGGEGGGAGVEDEEVVVGWRWVGFAEAGD